MINIPFLSLKDVTALHEAEINEAVTRVVNSGWYLQGKGNGQLGVPTGWMHSSGSSVHISKWV